MKATYSPTTGYCLIDTADGCPVVVNPITGESWETDQERCAAYLAVVDDWTAATAADLDELLDSVAESYRLTLAHNVTLVCFQLSDSSDCAPGLVRHVEDSLQLLPVSRLLARLLVAPLDRPDKATRLSLVATKQACFAAASFFDTIAKAQPFITRLSEHWLDVPEADFQACSRLKSEYWTAFVEVGFPQLLSHPAKLGEIWNALVVGMREPSAAGNKALIKVGRDLATRLKSGAVVRRIGDFGLLEEEDASFDGSSVSASDSAWLRLPPHRRRIRVERLIRQIVAAADLGRLTEARTKVAELIGVQTLDERDRKHLVKSLCNVAAQCKERYLFDFEGECLRHAAQLAPADLHVVGQLGDHYKRLGEFDDAKRVLSSRLADPIVAQTLADVHTCEGDFQTALSMYEELLPRSPDVVLAIADVYRKMRRYDEAEQYYAKAEREPTIDLARVAAGRAEIARQRGDFRAAITLYERATSMVSSRADASAAERSVYATALANVLKLNGAAQSALAAIDRAHELTPHSPYVWAVRGAILGLLGREAEAIVADLRRAPQIKEWATLFVHGVMLLKLARYDEAATHLRSATHQTGETGRAEASQLAVALSYLAQRQTDKAGVVLRGTFREAYTQHVQLVLQLHAATLDRDDARKRELFQALSNRPNVPDGILRVVTHLMNNDVARALSLEVDVVLALAA